MKKKEYFSIRETAIYFAVSEATIRKFVVSKKIKTISLGNVYRIPRAEIEKIKETGVLLKKHKPIEIKPIETKSIA